MVLYHLPPSVLTNQHTRLYSKYHRRTVRTSSVSEVTKSSLKVTVEEVEGRRRAVENHRRNGYERERVSWVEKVFMVVEGQDTFIKNKS